MAKVLVYDIECSPAVIYSWGLGKGYHTLGDLIEEPRIICIAAKWAGKRPTTFLSEWGDGRQEMLKGIRALFDQADVVLGFNSRSFDTPWVKGELIREGFTPPSPFAEIDLYRESRQFRYVSHKLAHLSRILTSDSKMDTGGFGLWKAALAGDTKAQNKMKRYNIQDVKVTEDLYEAMKPWLKKPVPPVLLGLDERDCPRCESKGTLEKRGLAATQLTTFQRYRCTSCGGWTRGKRALDTTENRAV